MKFLSDYNEIISRYHIRCKEASVWIKQKYGVELVDAEENAANKMGLTVEEFEIEREEFWNDVIGRQPVTLLWSLRILFLFYKKRMKVERPVYQYTHWFLPNRYDLVYDDSSHSWSLDSGGSILSSTTLVNSVYCKKGLLYKFVCNYLRKKAAELRHVEDWKNLDKLSEQL
jgi:hypothetical protein